MFGGGAFGGAPFGGDSQTASGAGFAISPAAGHTAGAVTITVTYSGGAICPGSMPISISSGGGSVASWVQDVSGADGSGHFTFTAPAASGTPTVFLDSVTGTTQSYSNAAVVPSAPVIGTAVKGNTTASVPYTASTDDGGDTISGYTATSTPGSLTGTGSSPITVTGLTNGTAYTFTVRATNGVGNSAESSASNSVTPSTTPSAPTIGTAIAGSGSASVAFTPGSTGGATATYTATSNPGGITGSGSASPVIVSGLTDGVAYTFTVVASNINGDSSASSASNSVTPAAATQSASFDGTGSNYLKVTCPTEVQTYPFWVSHWQRMFQYLTYTTVYCPWSAERTSSGGTNGQGVTCVVVEYQPWAYVANGTPADKAQSEESIIADPYWDNILCEYISATSRNVYINNVLEGSNATNVTPDFSTGSPEFRIGRRGLSGSTQYMKGEIADVLCGAGTLSADDRALLATVGAAYSGVASAAHWWRLNGDGADSIGSATMTEVGTMAYVSERPATIASPTRAEAINHVFKTTTLPTDTPTVTPGGSPPITVTTNLASVEYIDWSFTGSFGAYNGRHWHYIPTTSLDHVVFVNGGHQFAADAATYGMDDMVQQLVAEGYAVVLSFMPSFDAENPDYPGSSAVHNSYRQTSYATVNPIERFIQPNVMVMNNMEARYTTRSVCGLSGGGWLAVHYGALDGRINDSIISIRGGLADRRSPLDHDFEQWPAPNGWKVEEFFKLCAQSNRKVTFVVHESDPSITAKLQSTDHGAYLDAAGYTARFLTPILSTYPSAQITFYEDQGASPHAVTQDALDNAVFPTLAASLIEIVGLVQVSVRRGQSGINYYGNRR